MTQKIKIPVTFNPMKHHLGHVIQITENLKNHGSNDVYNELLMIGDNLADLYTGKLGIDEILTEIQVIMNASKVSNREDFINWLADSDFRKITLSDSSFWIIKSTSGNENFIHIHPGKKSPNTIRVKGSTLKTVLAFATTGKKLASANQLKEVNQIRSQWLNLSPVKTLQQAKGILKMAKLFNDFRANCFPATEEC